MELWNEDFLKILLVDMGVVIKVDHITLERWKGKFARVCLNIDVTKSLPISVNLNCFGKAMEILLIYEGFQKICIYCGVEAHKLDKA